MWKEMMQEALSKRPLFFWVLFLVMGTACGKLYFNNFQEYLSLYLIFIITGLIFLLTLILYRRFPEYFYTGALVFFFFLGLFNFQRAIFLPPGDISNFAGSQVALEGIVWEEPLIDKNRTVFDLKVLDINDSSIQERTTGKVRVTLYGQGELDYGDRVELRGDLKVPPGERNPGGFDYGFHLLTRGVTATMQVRDFHQVEVLSVGEGNWFISQSLTLKNQILDIIEKNLPSEEGSLLAGIILGAREELSPRLEESFRRAGMAHVLAVSGLHIGLIALLLLQLFRLFKIKQDFSWLLILILIFIYLSVIGFKPSALRAALMLSLGAGAFLVKKDKDPLTALALAALIILIVKPLWLFTISFQMSFMAVLSIITLTPFLEEKMSLLPSLLKKIISVTLAAQLGILPLTAYYFFEISLMALLANILVLPFLGIIIGLGFLSILSTLIITYAGFFFFEINRLFLSYIIWTAEALSGIPGAYVMVNPPRPLTIFFYYFFILVLLPNSSIIISQGKEVKTRVRHKTGKKNYSLLVGGMVLAVLLIWLPAFQGQPSLEAVFLDVGQGDSIFIRTFSGKNILIDGGGRPAYVYEEEYGQDFIGERVVVPFLRHQGVRKLDLVIISHPHEDHYGGLIPVIEQFPVDLIIASPAESDFFLYQNLMDLIAEKEIPLMYFRTGDSIAGNNLVMDFYNPPERLFSGTSSDLNNNSLVFKLTAGEVDFLFTGDAEYPAENYMLESNYDLSSHILKVGHHGSSSSSGENFLEAVNPEIAVIQVGENPFGHPSFQTLESLEQREVSAYRMDRDGAVTVTTDGDKIWVESFLSE